MMDVQDISQTTFDGLKVKKLYKTNRFETLLITIEQGHELPNHATSNQAQLIMHKGEAVFRINEQKIPLTPGITFSIPANETHSVEAKKDSLFFLIR